MTVVSSAVRDAEEAARAAKATALQEAKAKGRGTIVLETARDASRETLVLHAASGDAARRA